jgi:hypothetical protein
MLSVDIYGSLVHTPDPPEIIDNWHLPKSEQVWVRQELPDIFEDIAYDKDGNAKLTVEQKAYAAKEVERCRSGYWFYNNGIPTFISGKNYFYIQWWKLEDDIYPDYRDADRRYFLFLDYWEHVLWCLGIFRGKKRREGASSQATANLIYECIFFTNSNCGLVSKTQIDSRDTFTDMVSFGFNQLPIFLKPRQLNRADSVSELVFAARIEKGKNTGKGQRSKVTYRAPVENAFDRGRISRLVGDEGGKWPNEVKFSKFIAKVSKTMVQGARRVGFAECPSTVNELTKGGGAEFKKVFEGANQFKTGGRKTPNRFVTYFSPAYDNYQGFVDMYGMSVIDAPTEEQYEYLVQKWVVKDPVTGETVSEISEEDIKLGGKVYIYSRRKGLTGDLLEEEIRQNPCTVQEMFEAANTDCAFNSANIHQRQRQLEENPIFKRDVIYYRMEDGSVNWRDATANEKNFHWKMTSILPRSEANKFKFDGRQKVPDNIRDGAITVDSYSNSQGGRKYGSKASAFIGRRFNILDPLNTGRAIGHLYGRPTEKDTLHNQVLLAAEYHGYLVYYEHTADDYDGYFKDRAKRGYLGKYPLSLIDPTKREDADRHRGTPITPFSLTKQLDSGIAYFEHHCDMIDFEEILENALLFDPYNRTAYDTMVSFLMLISILAEPVYTPKNPPGRLIPIYDEESTYETV